MKKLMIAFAAVAMAVSANAAATKWNVTGMRTPSAADPTQAESGIVPPTSAAFLAVAVDLYYEGELVASGETNANGMMLAKELWNQATTITKTEAAGTTTLSFDLAATYVATEGTYVYSGTASANLGNVVSGSKDVTILFAAGNAGSWSFTPGAVPEPTSGLLLLIGVAGLALRRRRA